MTTPLGRVVDLVTERAAGQSFRIGLEAIEATTGRMVADPVTDYEGDGIAFGPGDVLFGKLRPYLAKAWMADRAGAAVGEFHVYRPDVERLDGSFLRWVLLGRSFLDQVVSSVVGAKMPRAEWNFVRSVGIHLPSLDLQRAIAAYLDRETARIDTLIEEQQRLIEMLRERRAAVLSVTFESGPSTEETKLGRVLAMRPSYGVLVPKYVDEADGVPLVRVGDLSDLDHERPMLTIAPEQSEEYARTKLAGGEVLLGVVGKMGQAALAPQWLAGANVARAVAVLRCSDPALAPLLCAWLGSNPFLLQAELATSGDSIQPTLGMKDLARFEINLPIDPDTTKHLPSALAKIDQFIAETERFIELSRERRAALITAAVTGQIDVREVA